MGWGGTGYKGWPAVTIPIPTPTAPGSFPYWFKFCFSHTDFQTAGLTNSITAYALPAGCIVHGVKLKHSVAFAGTGITAYNLSVGFSGALDDLLIAYPVTPAPANDLFALGLNFDSRNHAAAVNILLTAESTGANLDQSTAGDVCLWILVSEAL